MTPLDLVCATCGALPGAPCAGIAPDTHPLRSASGRPNPDDAIADLEAALVRTTRELVLERLRGDGLESQLQSQSVASYQLVAQWAETVGLAQRALRALEAVHRADSLHEAHDAATLALDEARPRRPAQA